MNKLVFSLLLISLLAIPAAAVPVCFEPTDLPPLTFAQNNIPRFTIGADGKFYVGGFSTDQANSIVFASNSSTAWVGSAIAHMLAPSALQAHPDASKANWVFAGSIGTSANNAGYAVTSDSRTWYINPETAGSQYYATAAPLFKSILVVDSLTNKLYNLSASSPQGPTPLLGLSVVGTFPVGVKPIQITASGSRVYAMNKTANKIYVGSWDPANSKYVLVLAGTAINQNPIMKLLAASNGKIYYGDNAGVVSNALTVETPLFTLDGQFSDFLEYNGSIIAVSNGNPLAKADRLFGVYNGITSSYVLVNSTFEQPDFRPRKLAVNPIDTRLYVLVLEASQFKIYKVKPTCLGFTVAPSNSAPVVSISGPVVALANSSAQFVATGSDAENNGLFYNWTQLSGPVLNASAWNYSALNSSVSIFFSQNGTYIFNVNVTDNGMPNLSSNMNWSLVVNATQTVQQPPVNRTPPVNNTIPECIVSAECSANQECIAHSCVLLECLTGEIIQAHRCVEPAPTTLCGGVQRTGEGTCCSGQWLPGQTTCPAPQNSSSTNHTVPVNGGVNASQSPLAFLDKLTNNNSTANYAIIVVVVLVLLGLVYFLFLKKKPPKQELQDELDQPLATDAGSSETPSDEQSAS